MGKSISIIGAGMGGLAAGIYGRLNGYRTTIFEQHYLPGGQCTSWKRKGYRFDPCIHHFIGVDPSSRICSLWEELGALPREFATTQECVSVSSPDGRTFHDYYDTVRLEQHMKELSTADSREIERYVNAIPRFARLDLAGEVLMGTKPRALGTMLALFPLIWRFRQSMEGYASRFNDPLLRRAFPLLEYSFPHLPFFLHLFKKGQGQAGNIAWPIGGSLEFAKSIEKRYLDLGGEIHYRQKAVKVLTGGGRAIGVQLENGEVHRSDIVVSNADGRKSIMELLGGRYLNGKIRKACEAPEDETNWAVHVFLGVNRDLSREPSALVQILDEPVTIAGHTARNIEMQMYGMDPSMAPEGKGTIKVELFSKYSYWKELSKNRARYEEEKQRVADAVIDILDRTRFPGIRADIEVVDVPTLMTWERYIGGTHGFLSAPPGDLSPAKMFFGRGYAVLPGLSGFYLVGTWATATGALFSNARSGRMAIRAICAAGGKPFRTS